MKNLRLVVLAIMAVATLSGCSVNRNASDYELCQQMSGDTFYSGSDAAAVMQQRLQAGTSTLSPSDCAAIAQGTAAQYQQSAANLNAVAMQQQALQAAQQRANTPINVNVHQW